MRLVFFDLETGGLDCKVHPIIQIAAIAVDDSLDVIEEIEIKLQFDEASATKEALEVVGYSSHNWSNAIPPAAACTRFANFLKRYTDIRMVSQRTGNPYKVAQLVGHNAASFDGPFIHHLFQAHNVFMPASYRILDTLQRAMWHFHERGIEVENFRLETLCNHFGVDIEGAHDALVDVRATVGLYRALVQPTG